MKRTVFIIAMLLILSPFFLFADDSVVYVDESSIEDTRVAAFMERFNYWFGEDPEIDLILFTYDKDYDIYSVEFYFKTGEELDVDFDGYFIDMYFWDSEPLDAKDRSLAIEAINIYNDNNYYWSFGSLFLQENNYLSLVYRVLDESVADIGEFVFWHFSIFRNYAFDACSTIRKIL